MIRKARAVWRGSGRSGNGDLSSDSGVLAKTPYSFRTRFENEKGTNPEELLAAAHASCFSMAFSSGLSKLGHAPERLDVKATCTFDKVGDQWTVTTMELNVKGKVPGIAPAQFEEAAKAASLGCPISRALKGNVNIRVVASLA